MARVGGLAVVLGLVAARRELLPLLQPLRVCVALAIGGGICTFRVVPHMHASFLKAGLTGIDLNKPTTRRDASGALVRPYVGPAVPEAMGAVSCAVYLICLFLFIPVPFAQPGVPALSDGLFPHAELSRLLCALLSICCMCFLGFADNVLDLRWRDRLVLPLAASLPVLMTYAASGGVTTIKVPAALQALVGLSLVDIGALYYGYISLLAIFCTNAINILAGVNGLEVGQSVVIGITIAAFNVVQVRRRRPRTLAPRRARARSRSRDLGAGAHARCAALPCSAWFGTRARGSSCVGRTTRCCAATTSSACTLSCHSSDARSVRAHAHASRARRLGAR
jgi:UDP-N-acetylmuramyl pentapeptide phosphotransferase/UDP-N-acetylglucosamine-1-phosphate transferase